MPPVTTSPLPTRPPWKVALVDDEPSVREIWSSAINGFPGFTCVCTCPSAEEALRVIPGTKPDIVLMDIFLRRLSGIECTARLKAVLPSVPIIMLTAIADDHVIFMALEAGADGYLLKSMKPADLQAALLDVLNGGAPMTSQIAKRVVRYFRQNAKAANPEARLSTREDQILVLLAKGYSNKEIADQLTLSMATVCSYLRRVYEKLHVHSRTAAVARYFPSGPSRDHP